jgi:hypothetical protein
MSISGSDPGELEPVARTLQIIVAAMIMGVLAFLAVVVLLVPQAVVPQGPAGAEAAPNRLGGMQVITLTALFMGATGLVLSYMVPILVVARGRSQIAREKQVPGGLAEPSPTSQASDAGRLLGLYQNQLIMGSALAEGGAFFAAMAYMLERHPAALGVAVVLVGALIARIPTRDRLTAWLDQQLALVQEERQAGS